MRLSSYPVCMLVHSHDLLGHLNGTILNVVSSTCALPAVTRQNICWEKACWDTASVCILPDSSLSNSGRVGKLNLVVKTLKVRRTHAVCSTCCIHRQYIVGGSEYSQRLLVRLYRPQREIYSQMWVKADLLAQPLFKASIRVVIWSMYSPHACYVMFIQQETCRAAPLFFIQTVVFYLCQRNEHMVAGILFQDLVVLVLQTKIKFQVIVSSAVATTCQLSEYQIK